MNVTDKHVAENKAAINKNIKNKMNKKMLKQIVSQELDLLFRTDHWGTEDQIAMENIILDRSGMECKDQETIEEYYLRIYDSI